MLAGSYSRDRFGYTPFVSCSYETLIQVPDDPNFCVYPASSPKMKDISSENEETRGRGEELLNKALDATAKIGSKYLGGVLYSTLGKYRKPATAANMQNSADILRRLCARAKDLGVTIGLEPCNRYETNVINTAAETMAFIDKIGADNAVVHLDTYHMHIEERYEDAVNVCGNRAGYLHIGESHRGILGTGNIVRSLIEYLLLQWNEIAH